MVCDRPIAKNEVWFHNRFLAAVRSKDARSLGTGWEFEGCFLGLRSQTAHQLYELYQDTNRKICRPRIHLHHCQPYPTLILLLVLFVYTLLVAATYLDDVQAERECDNVA